MDCSHWYTTSFSYLFCRLSDATTIVHLLILYLKCFAKCNCICKDMLLTNRFFIYLFFSWVSSVSANMYLYKFLHVLCLGILLWRSGPLDISGFSWNWFCSKFGCRTGLEESLSLRLKNISKRHLSENKRQHPIMNKVQAELNWLWTEGGYVFVTNYFQLVVFVVAMIPVQCLWILVLTCSWGFAECMNYFQGSLTLSMESTVT